MKRFFIALISVVMFFSYIPLSAAADDATGHWSEKDIRKLVEKGYMKGYEDGSFRPDKAVTRAEFAELIVKTLGLKATDSSTAAIEEKQFKDVKSGAWYYPSVSVAVEAGIVKGYPENEFLPDQKITRQQMATMLMRAIGTKGNFLEEAQLNFKDSNMIHSDHKKDVQKIVYLRIMVGNPENLFNPTSSATRGETATVLSRMIDIIDPPPTYNVASLNNSGEYSIAAEYDSFSSAKSAMKDNQVVIQGNRVVYMKSGMAVAVPFTQSTTVVYASSSLSGSNKTYVSLGTEMKYIDATEKAVKIQVANTIGYVNAKDVKLIPESIVGNNRSYYTRIDSTVNSKVYSELYHKIYNPIANSWSSLLVGVAPSFMSENQKYYSWDGIVYYNQDGMKESYSYFNILPLHTKTNYSAQEIDKYLKNYYPSNSYKNFPDSPLVGTGQFYKDMEQKYGVNALYLMAHAIHESAWGTSNIAQTKKNLYGINAVDSDPERSADEYKSFKESIERAAEFVSIGYHSPLIRTTNSVVDNWKYNGAVLGNKSIGMNVWYASDPYWGEKIAGHMYKADKVLGGKDSNAVNKIAINTVDSLAIRPSYGTSVDPIYRLKTAGIPFIFSETKQINGATWYKIITDDPNNRTGYVYGTGSLGQYVKEITIAK